MLGFYCALDSIILVRLLLEIVKQQLMLRTLTGLSILLQALHIVLIVEMYLERGMGTVSWVLAFLTGMFFFCFVKFQHWTF